MTPEHWQRVKALLEAALEREPNERAAFLDRACQGDDALRRQVDSLIISHDQADRFIEEPAFGLMADSLANSGAEALVGFTVGHYKLLAQLGVGGMGEFTWLRTHGSVARSRSNFCPRISPPTTSECTVSSKKRGPPLR